ncbi:MAG TPA: hypothetical protein VEB19_17825 [Gemmatimonadaceae bacterium]|nr:hypothetical protein [Gemmatimonadaceae bacterium]
MASHGLFVIAGERPRETKPKTDIPLERLARRWRNSGAIDRREQPDDIISLMDGWIRLLERSVARVDGPRPR